MKSAAQDRVTGWPERLRQIEEARRIKCPTCRERRLRELSRV